METRDGVGPFSPFLLPRSTDSAPNHLRLARGREAHSPRRALRAIRFYGGPKLTEGRSQRCTTDRNPLSRLCRTPRSCGGTRSAPGDELMYRRFAHQGPVGMPKPSTMSTSKTVVRFIKAPRKTVYEALLDTAIVVSYIPSGQVDGRV